MQDKRVIQQVGLILHRGWFSGRKRRGGRRVCLRPEGGTFAAGTHKGTVIGLALVALIQELLECIVPRRAQRCGRRSLHVGGKKGPVEQNTAQDDEREEG